MEGQMSQEATGSGSLEYLCLWLKRNNLSNQQCWLRPFLSSKNLSRPLVFFNLFEDFLCILMFRCNDIKTYSLSVMFFRKSTWVPEKFLKNTDDKQSSTNIYIYIYLYIHIICLYIYDIWKYEDIVRNTYSHNSFTISTYTWCFPSHHFPWSPKKQTFLIQEKGVAFICDLRVKNQNQHNLSFFFKACLKHHQFASNPRRSSRKQNPRWFAVKRLESAAFFSPLLRSQKSLTSIFAFRSEGLRPFR